MRPSEVLPQHRETIRQLVLEAGMANPRVFRSSTTINLLQAHNGSEPAPSHIRLGVAF